MAKQPDQAPNRLTADPPDPQVGVERDPAPPSTAELEAMRQALADLNSRARAAEERSDRLEAELRENARIVELMKGGDDIDLVALDAKWKNREEARRRIWKRARGRKVVVQFHTDRDPNRNYLVHLNLNGRVFNVPRGVPYELPGEYLELIDRAMVNHVTREVGPDGSPKTVVYDYFSYPYVVLSGLEDCDPGDRARAAA